MKEHLFFAHEFMLDENEADWFVSHHNRHQANTLRLFFGRGFFAYEGYLPQGTYDGILERLSQEELFILDIGSGNGGAMNQLLWSINYATITTDGLRLPKRFKVEGLDLNTYIPQVLETNNPQTMFHKTSFEQFVPEKQYDIIFSINQLQYAKDKLASIQKVHAMLKPAGQGYVHLEDLMFSTIDQESLRPQTVYNSKDFLMSAFPGYENDLEVQENCLVITKHSDQLKTPYAHVTNILGEYSTGWLVKDLIAQREEAAAIKDHLEKSATPAAKSLQEIHSIRFGHRP